MQGVRLPLHGWAVPVSGSSMMDRYEIAWRIWCWREGYLQFQDREGI